MPNDQWSLQDAKNKLSAVVEAARGGAAQLVTRRGKPAVVVLAVEEYERLRELQRLTAPPLGEHLLAMPQDDGDFHRAAIDPRSVDLS